jgi:hypothetical protein
MILCCGLLSMLACRGVGRAERLTDDHFSKHLQLMSKSHISAITKVYEVAKNQNAKLVGNEEFGPRLDVWIIPQSKKPRFPDVRVVRVERHEELATCGQ